MTRSPVSAAFRAEATALALLVAGLDEADLSRPSPCPPWTIAGLLCHVVIAAGRIDQAIKAAAGTEGDLTTATGYYRHDARFSADVNADRIDIAAQLAARLRTAGAIRAELTAATSRSAALLEAGPAGQQVRTRHGDRMLLSEFAVTRVVELAVHGLDLAAGLGRASWLTSEAASVLEDLLLPGGPRDARALQAELGCDRAGLIARIAGRVPLSEADSAALASHGGTLLLLG